MKPTHEEMLKALGWTVVCESPYEMEHEDGSTATGTAAKMIIDAAPKEYDSLQKELELERLEERNKNAVSGLDLHAINGREIIEFLDNAVKDYDDEMHMILCDVSICGFKFEGQDCDGDEYNLYFSGVFDNWGHKEDIGGQTLTITNEGMKLDLTEPFWGDGSDDAIIEVLEMWIPTHEFATDSEEQFSKLIVKAQKSLQRIDFKSHHELQETIERLKEAQTYMK